MNLQKEALAEWRKRAGKRRIGQLHRGLAAVVAGLKEVSHAAEWARRKHAILAQSQLQ